MNESMTGSLNEVIASQTAWAERHGIPFDASSRCGSVQDNLFMSLNPHSAEEFGGGAGGELGTPEEPGSMASLRSSSALAVNVFDAWRDGDPTPLAPLLNSDPSADRVRFEVTYPAGLRGIPPHLDVVIDRPGGFPLAIESKFTEIYSPSHNEFRPSYFESPELWSGFEQTREVALAIHDGTEQFTHLGPAQLIKHALGLKHAHGSKGFRLLYLWYQWPSEIADVHRAEIERFSEAVSGDFEFAALTYQELFDGLRRISGPRAGYLDYLADRYFPDD